VAAARKAAGDLKDPWQVAVALERATRDLITKPDYSQGFASAAEVIESGAGDCTEHAVLLAALARARGIPARVAIGLVYVDRQFLYHMWSEVFVDGRWIPLDGTLARGGIGAAHLKLSHSNLQGASAFSAMLPVAQVAGRLRIEILDVE
jgi:transglutaminase-like putative cysteine protease